MRDKLIELIKSGGVIIPETAEAVADYLIANKVFVLPEKLNDSWELALPFMMRLFVANEEEIAKIKAEFELSQKKQILTDIRDYLVEARGNWKERNKVIGLSLEQSLVDIGVDCWIDKALADLTDYAEKLGVEL